MTVAKPTITGRVGALLQDVLAAWFFPPASWMATWIERLWLAALGLIGLFQWGELLDWGRIPFQLADWFDVTGPRLAFLRDALLRSVLPLHVPFAEGMKGVTDRFLTIPDIPLSPQVLLLRWMEPGSFVLVNTLLLYTLGCWGLMRLRKRFGLALAPFTVLFLLVNFNGGMVAHLSVGHFNWAGCFLIPFFAEMIFDLVEHPVGWKWVRNISLLLLLVFLQGMFHLFVWCLWFLAGLALFNSRLRRASLWALVFSVLLCLFRILPGALVSADLKIDFQSGFTTLGELLRGLVSLVEISKSLETRTLLSPLIGWWEFDFYLGWLGLAFLVGGVFFWLRSRQQRAVIAPLVVLVLFSIGRLYKPIFLLNIPLLNGERVASRIFLLPIVFGLILAATALQQLLERRHPGVGVQLGLLSGLLVLMNDLLQHFELWKVTHLDTLFPPNTDTLGQWVVSNHPDPLYIALLAAGAGLSLAALTCLLWLARNNQQRFLNSE